jgi:hypothetical protein
MITSSARPKVSFRLRSGSGSGGRIVVRRSEKASFELLQEHARPDSEIDRDAVLEGDVEFLEAKRHRAKSDRVDATRGERVRGP